jgi:hypothetical protein
LWHPLTTKETDVQKDALCNGRLEVQIDADTLELTVTDLGSGVRWTCEQSARPDVRVVHGRTETAAYLREAHSKELSRFSTPSEERLALGLTGLPGGVGVCITLALPAGEAVLRCEIEPLPVTSASHVAEVWFPGPLNPVNDRTVHTVYPNAGGMIIPAHHDQEIQATTAIYAGSEVLRLPYAMAYTHALYGPWWGVVGEKAAYAAMAETPFDFALELRHPQGGPTSTRAVWAPSLGRLSYPRAIRYQFLGDADHVAVAKAYRAYVQGNGTWVSLGEKLRRNPVAERLIGGVIFPVSICRHDVRAPITRREVVSFEQRARQVRRLREMGLDRVFLHVDGWGFRGYDNQHPGILPPCPEAGGWEGLVELSRVARECGYLFGLHDQYRDYYLDGPDFAESRAVVAPDGSMPQWSRWAGGPQAALCAKEALPHVRRNFRELLGRGAHLTASYLDVFAIIPLDECCDTRHPMTREDCFRWRAKAFDHVRSLGLAISSEEPVDCFIPHLDFTHWAPYPCEGFRYRTGQYWGIPAPLHSLVYHDALLVPAVFDSQAGSDARGRHFLEGLSQVQMPYGSIEWDDPSCFRAVDVLAQLHDAWAMHELVDHSLLDSEGMIQRFEYPEGAISIDLAALKYRVEGGPVATEGWVPVEL